MKNSENTAEISGVLHQKAAPEDYDLRRYLPTNKNHLKALVEQYWIVSWDLTHQRVQKNLPDPNFHLTFDGAELKLIGPISSSYSFTMKGKQSLIGIKFNIGALNGLLPSPLKNYVDKELIISGDSELRKLGKVDMMSLLLVLKERGLPHSKAHDIDLIETIENDFSCIEVAENRDVTALQKAMSLLKERGLTSDKTPILRVETLAENSGLSVRQLQRLFKTYVGLPPKWLIRKYRLHEAIALLDSGALTLTELTYRLGYHDQSHLNKDFSAFLGISPNSY